MNRKRTFLSLALMPLFMLVLSCLSTIVEVKNWMEANSIEEITGKYHYLENDGIKIYLPEVFERYSAVEYQTLLDSLVTKQDFEFETKRLKTLRDIPGDFYIFFDEETGSTYTVNTLPYAPITKADAQFLLNMITVSYERSTQDSDLSFKKLTAKYNGSKNQDIFRSIHRIDNSKTNEEVYNAAYIISSNNKTVWIQITTPFEVNFDMFIQKMIL